MRSPRPLFFWGCAHADCETNGVGGGVGDADGPLVQALLGG